MKSEHILLQILCISLLACLFTQAQAQQSDLSRNLNSPNNENTLVRQSLPIKFERPEPHQARVGSGPFTFPLQFSSENITIPVVITTSTNSLWINSDSYSVLKGAPFKCSKSKSCKGSEPQELSWGVGWFEQRSWGVLAKEQISFGGLTLPSFDVSMTNHSLQPGEDFLRKNSGTLGLSFGGTSPTIIEYLQKENLVKEPVVSIDLHDNYNGELVFGGYPANKTRADYKFVPLQTEAYFTRFAGLHVPINGIGFKDYALEGRDAILDFERTYISLPKWTYDRINDLVNDLGLEISYPPRPGVPFSHPNGQRPVKCSARSAFKDLTVEFGGFSLKIPTSCYIIKTKGFIYDNDDESTEEGCFLAILPQDGADHQIVLGQPFFKAYSVVFDYGHNSIGFSKKDVLDFTPPQHDLTIYIMGTIVLAGLVLIGFCISHFGIAKRFRKSYVPLEEEEGKKKSTEPSAAVTESLPSQVEVGVSVQILPYQDRSQN